MLNLEEKSVAKNSKKKYVALALAVVAILALVWTGRESLSLSNNEHHQQHIESGKPLRISKESGSDVGGVDQPSTEEDFFNINSIMGPPMRVIQPKYTPPGGNPCISVWMAVSMAKAAYQLNGRLAERMLQRRRRGDWGGCRTCRTVSVKHVSGIGGRWWAYAFLDAYDNLYVAFRGSNIDPQKGGNFPGNIMMPFGKSNAYMLEISSYNAWLAQIEAQYGGAYAYVGHSAGGYFALRVRSRSGKTWRITYNAPGSESGKYVINFRTHGDELSADTNQYIKVGPRNAGHALDNFKFMTTSRHAYSWRSLSSKFRYYGCKVQVYSCRIRKGNDIAVLDDETSVRSFREAFEDVAPQSDVVPVQPELRKKWQRITTPAGKLVKQTAIDGNGLIWAVFTDGSVYRNPPSSRAFSFVTAIPKMSHIATSNSGFIVMAVGQSGKLYKFDGRRWRRQRKTNFQTVGVGSSLSYGTKKGDSIVRFSTRLSKSRACALPGRLKQISVHGRLVVGVSSSKKVYTYGSDGKWFRLHGDNTVWATRGTDGAIYRITTDDKIWRFAINIFRPPARWWKQMPGRAVKIDAANSEKMTVVSRNGRAYRWV